MKRLLAFSLLASIVSLHSLPAHASLVRLVPSSTPITRGSAFDVQVLADIDSADEIIGFGFDLLASPSLSYAGFTPGAAFADDPFYLAPFSDGDGIRGASGGDLLTGPAISGLGILLGTLHLLAHDVGLAALSLGADDLAGNFTEGLIPLSVLSRNFLPPIADAHLTVVPGQIPEPASPWGLAAALVAAMLAGSPLGHRTSSASRRAQLGHG